MKGWGMSGAAIGLAAAVVAWGCAPQKAPLSDQFRENLAEWRAGLAVDEGLRREIAETQDPEYGAPAPTVLMPGEPIWIQSGKSRIIQFPAPVRRVSISNPDLAGIVVLGPTARSWVKGPRSVPGRGPRDTYG